MGAQEGPQKLVLGVFFGLGLPLGAKMGQDGPKTPPEPSQDWFFLILEPNLVDFGTQLDGFFLILEPNLVDFRAQLGGFFLILEPNLEDFGIQLDGFWGPAWWILGPNLVDNPLTC